MGGLSSRMPVTYWTYLFGTFALAGLFPFAGFWSKDEILADAWHEGFFGHSALEQFAGFSVLVILLLAAFMTAFYMWRQIQMVFHGEPRSEGARQAPESSRWMTAPLVVLAFFALFVGFINLPEGGPFVGFLGLQSYEFKHWLEVAIPSITQGETLTFNWLLALIATGLAVAAIVLAHRIYAGDKAVVEDEDDPLGTDPLNKLDPRIARGWKISNARMYWDETYYRFIEGPYNRLSRFFADVIDWRFLHDYFHDRVIKRGYDTVANLLSKPLDIGIIDGVVNGVGWVVTRASQFTKPLQTGYVRTYAVILLLGVVLVVVVTLLPLLQNGQ